MIRNRIDVLLESLETAPNNVDGASLQSHLESLHWQMNAEQQERFKQLREDPPLSWPGSSTNQSPK